MSRETDRTLYAIQCDLTGRIKIGYATHLASRLSGIRGSSPTYLHLLGTTPGTGRDESRIHRRLRKWNVGGEWFLPSREVKKLVAEVFGAEAGDGALAEDWRLPPLEIEELAHDEAAREALVHKASEWLADVAHDLTLIGNTLGSAKGRGLASDMARVGALNRACHLMEQVVESLEDLTGARPRPRKRSKAKGGPMGRPRTLPPEQAAALLDEYETRGDVTARDFAAKHGIAYRTMMRALGWARAARNASPSLPLLPRREP